MINRLNRTTGRTSRPDKILTVLLMLILVVTLVPLVSCTSKRAERRETPKTERDSGQTERGVVGEDVSFTITEAAHKKWDLFAKKAVYFKDHSGAKLSEVKGSVFNDTGKEVAIFEAPAGEVYQQQNKVVLSGGVVARSVGDDGAVVMKAPRMTWSSKDELVTAETGVTLVRKGMGESSAQRCRFSLDFSQLYLEGNALSKINF